MTVPATEEPTVSVLIPSYNHAEWVEQAIASVLAQSYPHVQLVVIDDASNDGSQELIIRMQKSQPFTFLPNQHNLGLNPSLERALAAATGDYVAVLASDDLIEEDKIRRQVEHLRETNLDGVFSSGTRIFPDGRAEPIDSRVIANAFLHGDPLRLLYTTDTAGPYLQSGLFRMEIFRDLSWIRKNFRSDDWAFAIAMLQRYRIGFMDQRLFRYRIHESNSHQDYWRTFPMRAEVICALTPMHLRDEAIANLVASQGVYLTVDNQARRGARYHAAAFSLDPNRQRLWALLRMSMRPVAAAMGLTSAQRAQRAMRGGRGA